VVAGSPHEVDEELVALEGLPDERPLREPLVAIEVERGEADLAGVIVAPQPARATAQGRVVQAEGRLVAAVDALGRLEVAGRVGEVEHVVARGELRVDEAEALAVLGGALGAGVRVLGEHAPGLRFRDAQVDVRGAGMGAR
jgi:hypothetical protein